MASVPQPESDTRPEQTEGRTTRGRCEICDLFTIKLEYFGRLNPYDDESLLREFDAYERGIEWDGVGSEPAGTCASCWELLQHDPAAAAQAWDEGEIRRFRRSLMKQAAPDAAKWCVGVLLSDPARGHTQRCAFCANYWPPYVLLPDLPLCAHCAFRDTETAPAAALRCRRAGIRIPVPQGWSVVVRSNEGRACPDCGVAGDGDPPRKLGATLGVEHLCIACVVRRLRRAAATQRAPGADAVSEPAAPVTPPVLQCRGCRAGCPFPDEFEEALRRYREANAGRNPPRRSDLLAYYSMTKQAYYEQLGRHGATGENWPALCRTYDRALAVLKC